MDSAALSTVKAMRGTPTRLVTPCQPSLRIQSWNAPERVVPPHRKAVHARRLHVAVSTHPKTDPLRPGALIGGLFSAVGDSLAPHCGLEAHTRQTASMRARSLCLAA